MSTLLEKHPDLQFMLNDDIKRYTSLDEDGEILEAFERNDDGEFVDITAKLQLEAEIVKAQAELAKLQGET